MSLGNAIKDPDAVLPYKIDWTAWLAGDTLSTSTWSIPAGLTKVNDTTEAGTTAVVTLSGGAPGQIYVVTNRITTSDGRTDDRSFRLRIAER